jgi:hypothetical protein
MFAVQTASYLKDKKTLVIQINTTFFQKSCDFCEGARFRVDEVFAAIVAESLSRYN